MTPLIAVTSLSLSLPSNRIFIQILIELDSIVISLSPWHIANQNKMKTTYRNGLFIWSHNFFVSYPLWKLSASAVREGKERRGQIVWCQHHLERCDRYWLFRQSLGFSDHCSCWGNQRNWLTLLAKSVANCLGVGPGNVTRLPALKANWSWSWA